MVDPSKEGILWSLTWCATTGSCSIVVASVVVQVVKAAHLEQTVLMI